MLIESKRPTKHSKLFQLRSSSLYTLSNACKLCHGLFAIVGLVPVDDEAGAEGA